MQKTSVVTPPSPLLGLTELVRAAAEMRSLLAASPLLRSVERGASHAALVIPGFGAGDSSTYVLRRYLRKWGYRPEAWSQGVNLGFRQRLLRGVEQRLRHIHADSGLPVTLIGQSLGGIYARELARSHPDLVKQVITLGSPFAGPEGAAPLVNKIYSHLNPDRHVEREFDDIAQMRRQIKQAPPVPTTAVYSRGDGVVSWRACVQLNGDEQCENVEVRGSHCGMAVNPAVLYVIADRLAWEGDWRPFDRSGKRWRNLVYPEAVDARADLDHGDL